MDEPKSFHFSSSCSGQKFSHLWLFSFLHSNFSSQLLAQSIKHSPFFEGQNPHMFSPCAQNNTVLLTTAYNSQSLLTSVFLSEPTFFLSHLHLQPKKPSFCSSSTASSFSPESIFAWWSSAWYSQGWFFPAIYIQAHIFTLYLKCMPCHSFVADCLMTLITIFICRICAWSLAISPTRRWALWGKGLYLCSSYLYC